MPSRQGTGTMWREGPGYFAPTQLSATVRSRGSGYPPDSVESRNEEDAFAAVPGPAIESLERVEVRRRDGQLQVAAQRLPLERWFAGPRAGVPLSAKHAALHILKLDRSREGA